MPSASVSTVAKVKPGVLRNCRTAYATSWLRKPVVITQLPPPTSYVCNWVAVLGWLLSCCPGDACMGALAYGSCPLSDANVRQRTSAGSGTETDSLFRCLLYRLPGIQQGKIRSRGPHRRQIAVVRTVLIARFSRIIHCARIVPIAYVQHHAHGRPAQLQKIARAVGRRVHGKGATTGFAAVRHPTAFALLHPPPARKDVH